LNGFADLWAVEQQRRTHEAMCWHIERKIEGSDEVPALARRFIQAELISRLALSRRAEIIDDALLVVSELVTNAVCAGSSTVTVGVGSHGGDLKIEVTDGAGGWPEPHRAPDDSAHGRGLLLVEAFALEWGVTRVHHGKSVWAVLPL
jgi:signal transduction histidine kinase